MPPAAMGERISYGPSLRPDGSDIVYPNKGQPAAAESYALPGTKSQP